MCIYIFFSPTIEPLQKTALVFLCATLWQCTAQLGLEGKTVMEKALRQRLKKPKSFRVRYLAGCVFLAEICFPQLNSHLLQAHIMVQ